MGANPFLRATDVAAILKATASGHGQWNPETGSGVLDAAAAVAQAQGPNGLNVRGVRSSGSWTGAVSAFGDSEALSGVPAEPGRIVQAGMSGPSAAARAGA